GPGAGVVDRQSANARVHPAADESRSERNPGCAIPARDVARADATGAAELPAGVEGGAAPVVVGCECLDSGDVTTCDALTDRRPRVLARLAVGRPGRRARR